MKITGSGKRFLLGVVIVLWVQEVQGLVASGS